MSGHRPSSLWSAASAAEAESRRPGPSSALQWPAPAETLAGCRPNAGAGGGGPLAATAPAQPPRATSHAQAPFPTVTAHRVSGGGTGGRGGVAGGGGCEDSESGAADRRCSFSGGGPQMIRGVLRPAPVRPGAATSAVSNLLNPGELGGAGPLHSPPPPGQAGHGQPSAKPFGTIDGCIHAPSLAPAGLPSQTVPTMPPPAAAAGRVTAHVHPAQPGRGAVGNPPNGKVCEPPDWQNSGASMTETEAGLVANGLLRMVGSLHAEEKKKLLAVQSSAGGQCSRQEQFRLSIGESAGPAGDRSSLWPWTVQSELEDIRPDPARMAPRLADTEDDAIRCWLDGLGLGMYRDLLRREGWDGVEVSCLLLNPHSTSAHFI